MKKPTQQEVIALARQFQQENPALDSQAALTNAIQQLTGGLVTPSIAPKPPTKQAAPSSKKAIPGHVIRNINRVKQAEKERERNGGKLPTATFVQGGKVSPK